MVCYNYDVEGNVLEGYIVNILKIIGIIAGVIIVAVIAFFVIMNYYLSKEDPDYVLKYIKEHKEDETCSLLIKRNGEVNFYK